MKNVTSQYFLEIQSVTKIFLYYLLENSNFYWKFVYMYNLMDYLWSTRNLFDIFYNKVIKY